MEPTAFTNSEYEEYLVNNRIIMCQTQHKNWQVSQVDPRWTMEETRHLLELCHRFDLRYLQIWFKNIPIFI